MDMLKKPNWSEAPEDAQFYSSGYFRKIEEGVEYWFDDVYEPTEWEESLDFETLEEHKDYLDFEMRPSDYDESLDEKWDNQELGAEEDNQEELIELLDKSVKTSIQFLDQVKAIQEERAAEYEQEGGERSFAKIATVFNTYTGKNLQPSDVALILEILKNVRFYSQDGYHKDSVIDKISYGSLWAELVTQERDKR